MMRYHYFTYQRILGGQNFQNFDELHEIGIWRIINLHVTFFSLFS